jgi:protein TonB
MAYTRQNDLDRTAVRRRLLGIAATLIVEALLVLAFLSLTLQSSGPKTDKHGLSAFTLEAETESAPEDTAKSAAETPVKTETRRNIVPVIPKPLLPPINPVKVPPPNPDFIKVSKAEFDAMDLSKIPSSGSGSSAGDAKGAGQGSKGMMGPGAGPGGAQLYPVAWYREPYDAELAPYLSAAKAAPPGASAEIACRMIEHYHVENCQILGENPRGTGLARALRLAAWQFLVRPPRIDNKPQLGVWVRIRFDFGKAKPPEVDTVSE